MGAAEEVGGGHAAFAGGLEGEDFDGFSIACADGYGGAIHYYLSRGEIRGVGDAGFEDFYGTEFGVAIGEGRPGCGVGGEAADEVVDCLRGGVPVDFAGFLENLRCGSRFCVPDELVLWNSGECTRDDVVDGAEGEVGAEHHETVVHIAHVVSRQNLDTFLCNDVAGVNLMFQEEGGHAGLGVAVDDGPVDWGGAAVAGQEGGVEVECPEPGHSPDHFGEHTEGYHYEEVGVERPELTDKLGVLELDRLHEFQAAFKGELLDGRLIHLVAAARGLVGHCDHADHVIASVDYAAQAFYGEVGGAEKYYSEVLFSHCSVIGGETGTAVGAA